MLTKEEIRKSFTASYQDQPQETIDSMVEDTIHEMYGDIDQYEKRLAEYTKAQVQESDNGIDPDEFTELSEIHASLNGEINPDYANEAEVIARGYREQGLTYDEARLRAMSDLVNEHGQEVFPDIDSQLDHLIEAGYTNLAQHRTRIKVLSSMDETSILDAYKRVVSEEYRGKKEYDSLPESEKEFLSLLDTNDKAAVAGLRAADPDTWSKKPYEKFWRLMNPGKNKPAKPKPPTEGELRLQAAIEREQRELERLKQRYLSDGGSESEWQKLMDSIG